MGKITKNELSQSLAQSLSFGSQVATVQDKYVVLKELNNRILFQLEQDAPTVSGVSMLGVKYNLVDISGNPVTKLEKGFHEIVKSGNFFILRNKGGISKEDLEALVAITNEAELNDTALRMNYIDAVSLANKNIALTAESTWNDILQQIPNITSGSMKFSTGTGKRVNAYQYKITGLSFEPTHVFVYLPAGGSLYLTKTPELSIANEGSNTGAVTTSYSGGVLTINSGVGSFGNSGDYRWYVFG